jgi:site-specific recombinase XerD
MDATLTLSQSIDGFTLAAHARRLSPKTIADYQNTFRKFFYFLQDDPPLDSITPPIIRQFLAAQTVSKKTLLNYHTGLSALWTWAIDEGFASSHVVRRCERPQPEKRAILPYSESDIKAMLASLDKSRACFRPGQRSFSMSLPNADRNRALIFLLLDTGIRAQELCDLTIVHADLKNRRVKVFGKGARERAVPFSPRTGQVLWRYITSHRKDSYAGDPLFITDESKPLDRHVLRQALTRIGQRAGVPGVNVHRFRHTFAINFLRNGGDPWSLQLMLGHSTLDMVRNYLAIAQADIDSNHRQASPVSHWSI